MSLDYLKALKWGNIISSISTSTPMAVYRPDSDPELEKWDTECIPPACCVEVRWRPRFSFLTQLFLSLFMWTTDQNTMNVFQERKRSKVIDKEPAYRNHLWTKTGVTISAHIRPLYHVTDVPHIGHLITTKSSPWQRGSSIHWRGPWDVAESLGNNK